MFAFHRGAVQPGHQPDAAAHGPRSVALRMAAPQVMPYTLDSAAVYRLDQESERPMNGSDTPEPTPLNAPGPFYLISDDDDAPLMKSDAAHWLKRSLAYTDLGSWVMQLRDISEGLAATQVHARKRPV